MKFIVRANVNGTWHLIETITQQEAGGKVAAYKAALGLAKATQDFPRVSEVTVKRS
jgi:hypothetical protein